MAVGIMHPVSHTTDVGGFLLNDNLPIIYGVLIDE